MYIGLVAAGQRLISIRLSTIVNFVDLRSGAGFRTAVVLNSGRVIGLTESPVSVRNKFYIVTKSDAVFGDGETMRNEGIMPAWVIAGKYLGVRE
jgi:hypothetical protein